MIQGTKSTYFASLLAPDGPFWGAFWCLFDPLSELLGHLVALTCCRSLRRVRTYLWGAFLSPLARLSAQWWEPRKSLVNWGSIALGPPSMTPGVCWGGQKAIPVETLGDSPKWENEKGLLRSL